MTDFADILHAMVDSNRRKAFAASRQLSLGEFILKLEAIADKSKAIVFDFGPPYCSQLMDSWRGIYAELAIGYSDSANTVMEVLTEAYSAIGRSFTGWKGGDFVMSRQTPLWVANAGESGIRDYKARDDYASVGIIDVLDGDVVTIATEAMEPHT